MIPKLYGERINQVVNFLTERGTETRLVKQLLRAVYQSHMKSFVQMVELPLTVRQAMIGKFGETVSSLTPHASQAADSAHKVLFSCHDKGRIEAVSLSFRSHSSLCISSQLGCAFGCSFCETGKVGLKRQLTVSEITDQVLYFREKQKVDSISFMGMGEPLSNPKIFDGISCLTSPHQFGYSSSRVNVSTIGIVPGLLKLNEIHPNVNVAFSLHSPFPEQRLELMPIEKAYPFRDTLNILDDRIRRTRNRVWIAYLLLEGINDSLDHAHTLAGIIKNRSTDVRYLYHVNLLPYNPGRTPQDRLKRVDDITAFQRVLEKADIKNSYRNSFGRSIDAACGQLYAEYEAKSITQVMKEKASC